MSELNTEPLTYEKLMEMFKETREQQKETGLLMKETREQMNETAQRMKETDRLIGNLGNRFGELSEHLVAHGIVKKFNAIGFDFAEISPGGREFKDPKTKQHLAEVDIILENSDIFIAIEVRLKLRKLDVDEHINRMEVLRRIADSKNDKRKYQGAIAAAITTTETKNYAHESGFYVLEQSGDTMKLDLPEGFTPRNW